MHKPINISPKMSKQMIPSSRICTIKRSGIETTISIQKSRSQHDEDEENFNGNDLFVCLCCGGTACWNWSSKRWANERWRLQSSAFLGLAIWCGTFSVSVASLSLAHCRPKRWSWAYAGCQLPIAMILIVIITCMVPVISLRFKAVLYLCLWMNKTFGP